ncbi:hypothetical protein [Thermococcus barophilus]|uniref:Membrane bound subgroup 4b [NiFe]-hydrogenase MBH(B)3, subunit Mbh(B)3X n=1 Tax=Thermococcus barophilus TaxID=55802 RepID=A0A0S1XD26_THEBA|nr:hypothetical protein [Thermococcus barophilus]ALM75667.1 Membrane bound subgroup 4b [NiFe]-hydrogenase MBH(b)3, subunit Mbh(b)3X [Thermococcus barophilus]
MPYQLVKSSYIGFKSELGRRLAHIDGDFLISEVIGKVSDDAGQLIIRSLKRSYFTLDDLPRLPLEELGEGDRKTLLRALKELKKGEKIEIKRR